MNTITFPVKYNKTIYTDAHMTYDGHIWFNNDTLEFIPKTDLYSEDTVIYHYTEIRDDKETHLSFVRSNASVIIMKNISKLYRS